jgi:ferredoxin
MNISIDKDKCISTGNCVLAAPELFDQSEDDGTVVVLNHTPEPELHESARQAAAACPALVIQIRE